MAQEDISRNHVLSVQSGGSISTFQMQKTDTTLYVGRAHGHTDADIYEGFIRLSFLGPNFPGFCLAQREDGISISVIFLSL